MLHELCTGFGSILLYYLIAVSLAVPLRKFGNVPHEVFRKLLHSILLGSLLVWTVVFQTWWLAALSALLFAGLLYPFLMFLERFAWISAFLTERKKGELKSSLLLVFAMYALVVTLCWGLLGEELIALCAVYAWGFGDAAAALVGKRMGRHALTGPHIEGTKSVEGTLAMFLVSFLSVLALLVYRGGMPWYGCGLTALVTAAVSALVELYSLKGRDTITCPLAAMAVLIPMTRLFGGGIG